MKRTITAVLMALMVSTPCFAQEIETDGIFSIEGTRWQGCPTWMILPSPQIGCNESGGYEIGFYQRKVYNSMGSFIGRVRLSFFVDMLGVSTYFGYTIAPPSGTIWVTGFMFPAVGLGIGVTFGSTHLIIPIFSISILNKAEDNWIPPESIFMISPFQGEQGTTLTDVTIMTEHTTLEDDGVRTILLMPPSGLAVSNINVISNTEVKFDLEIPVDAPVGSKEVYVALNDEMGYVGNSEVFFTVTAKKKLKTSLKLHCSKLTTIRHHQMLSKII